MAIDIEYRNDGVVIVVTPNEHVSIHEYLDMMDNTLIPYVREIAPKKVHMLYNLAHISWTFPDLMIYIKRTVERRKSTPPPTNVEHHFIGTGEWVNNWRSYMLKNFNLETGAFKNVEDALMYIREYGL